MSKSHRKRGDSSSSITSEKNASASNGISSSSKSRGIQKKKATGKKRGSKRHVLMNSRSGAQSIQKEGGFSKGALALLIGTVVLVIGGGVFFWDATVNRYGWLSMVTGYFTPALENNEENKEKTYAKLPINDTKPPGPAPKNMVWIPGGEFWMGSDDSSAQHYPSVPTHKVFVDGFWMAKYEATNAEWQEFINETGFKTVAEKKPDPRQFPTDKKELAKTHPPFSLVFSPPPKLVGGLRNHLQWWKLELAANWRWPEGKKGETITKKMNHPVVHIAWTDTQEFLKWKNKKRKPKDGWEYRLATEAEWEFAARGGKHRWKYLWHKEELTPNGKWYANIWQGKFPMHNSKADGYAATAPVGSYPPNPFGLHDMAGNVWEWCHDRYRDDYYKYTPDKNPTGPRLSHDPLERGMPKRVQRGGSFLCDASYCERYLTYARGKGEDFSAGNHVGFRYVLAKKIAAK